MSIADTLRLRELETAVATLVERLDALEARQVGEAPPAPPLGKHGGDHRKKQAANGISPIGSNSRAYILARLDRDRPDLAQRVRTKEISARGAAIAAGFGKRTVPADAAGAGRSGSVP